MAHHTPEPNSPSGTSTANVSLHNNDPFGKETEAAAFPDTAQHSEMDAEKVPVAGPPALMFNPADFPDGGFAAWLCVFGGFCCL